MVKVRAIQRCFVDQKLREPGAEFDYEGEINDGVMVAVEDFEPTEVPKPSKATKKAATKKAEEAKESPADPIDDE